MSSNILHLGVETGQYVPGMQAATAVTESFKASTMATLGSLTALGAGMTAAISVPIGLMNAASISAASDATEVSSKFATVFSTLSSESSATAAALSENYGLGITSSKELLANTGDLLSGFKFTQVEALSLSNRIQQLAIDTASFSNYAGGAAGASEALTKAVFGETEMAKGLGIVIRQDSEEFKNLVQHYMRTENATMQQAKAYAVLDIATEQSKNSIGDYARTMNDLANRMRYQTEMMKGLKEAYGGILVEGLHLNTLYGMLSAGTKALTATLNAVPGPLKTVIALTSVAAIATGPLLLGLGLVSLAYNQIVQAAPGVVFLYQAMKAKSIALTASTFALVTGTDLATFSFFKQQMGLRAALTDLSAHTLATWKLGAANVWLAAKNGILAVSHLTLTGSLVAVAGGFKIATAAAATFWTTAIAPLLPVIAVVGAVIAGVALVVAGLATQWDNLSASFGIMIDSFGVDLAWVGTAFSWLQDHASNIMSGVVAVVGIGLALIVTTLFAGVTSIVNGWNMIWATIEMTGSLVKTFATNTWNAIITTITTGWSVGWNGMLGTTKTITAGILDALGDLAVNAADLMDWIPGMGGAAEAVRGVGVSLGAKAEDMRTGAAENFATADAGKAEIKDAWANVGTDDKYNDILNKYSNNVLKLSAQTDKAWAAVDAVWTGAGEDIKNAFNGKGGKPKGNDSKATMAGQQKFAGVAYQGSVAAYKAEIRRGGKTSEDETAANTKETVDKLTQMVAFLRRQDQNLIEIRGV